MQMGRVARDFIDIIESDISSGPSSIEVTFIFKEGLLRERSVEKKL